MLSPERITAYLLRNQMALTAFYASVTRSFHLAEDVFQEVCIGAIAGTTRFESEDHLLNWARQTGKHRSIDVLRARDGRYDGLDHDVLDSLAASFHRVSLGQPDHKQEALRECLRNLGTHSFEIMRLRYFEGRSSAAIAQLVNRKVETVYQTITRIHKSLAECIQTRLHAREVGNESR